MLSVAFTIHGKESIVSYWWEDNLIIEIQNYFTEDWIAWWEILVNIILKFSKARLKIFKHFMVKWMISIYIIDILTKNAFKNKTKYNS